MPSYRARRSTLSPIFTPPTHRGGVIVGNTPSPIARLDLFNDPGFTENHLWQSGSSGGNSAVPAYVQAHPPYIQKRWVRSSEYANWVTPLSGDSITGDFDFEIDLAWGVNNAGNTTGNGRIGVGIASTDDWAVVVSTTMDGDDGADFDTAPVRLDVVDNISPGATAGYTLDATSAFDVSDDLNWGVTYTWKLAVVGTDVDLVDQDANTVFSLSASEDLSAKTWNRFIILGIRGSATTGVTTNWNDVFVRRARKV